MTQMAEITSATEFYGCVESICCRGLKQALNRRTGIYDRQLRNKQWGATLGTEDLTSTAICLIGISRAHVPKGRIGLDAARTIDEMLKLLCRRRYPGGLGLVVWANAVWDRVPLNKVLQQTGVSLDSIGEFLDSLTTMEVGWLLSGLAHEYHRRRTASIRRDVGVAIDTLLGRYQPRTHLMAHAGPKARLPHRLRRWVANFADQIYSIQALCFAAIVMDHEAAMHAAENLAGRLVELQGERGQWWWHYDPRSGEVSQAYSVYSVHQHGMAPMALAALAATGGQRFTEACDRGRAWLSQNELGVNMIDADTPTIWRSIDYDQGRIGGMSRKAQALLGRRVEQATVDDAKLRVNYETRPYEWAWCLYAGAIETGKDRGRHLV